MAFKTHAAKLSAEAPQRPSDLGKVGGCLGGRPLVQGTG